MTQPPEYPGSNDPNGNEPPSYPSSGSEPPSYQPPPPTHQAYGQQDYGQQYGQQYGQSGDNNPYGAWQGGNDAGKQTDTLSIVAFVLSLTCCLSFVGVILGFIGLGRTKNGQRKGRWAAITAIVVGIILTLVAIGGGIAIWQVVKNQIGLDDAEVGMCMNVDEVDDDSVSLTKKECGEDHDAEIVYVGEFEEVENSGFMPTNPDDVTDAGVAYGVCTRLLGDDAAKYEEALDGNVGYGIVNEDSSPEGDEKFLCYVEHSEGDKIDEKLS